MPIQREGDFLRTHDLGITSSIGIESERLEECVREAVAKDVRGVFGHPSFGFTQANLDFLADLPRVEQVWFWDVTLRSIDGLYALHGLRYFGIQPKRPPIDFSRFPLLEDVVWYHERRDRGLAASTSIRRLDLWHFKPRTKHFDGLELPPDLESLSLNWANPATLAGLCELPRLRTLEIHRCRNLESLDDLPRIAPNLEKLVVTTSGRLTDHDVVAAMRSLRLARLDGRDLLARAT